MGSAKVAILSLRSAFGLSGLLSIFMVISPKYEKKAIQTNKADSKIANSILSALLLPNALLTSQPPFINSAKGSISVYYNISAPTIHRAKIILEFQ